MDFLLWNFSWAEFPYFDLRDSAFNVNEVGRKICKVFETAWQLRAATGAPKHDKWELPSPTLRERSEAAVDLAIERGRSCSRGTAHYRSLAPTSGSDVHQVSSH